MENKKNVLLLVTGILLIIGGAIGLIGSIIALLGARVAVVLFADQEGVGLLVFAAVLLLLSAIVSLVTGILGVVNAGKPNKANVLIIFGIVTALLSVLGNILTVVAGGQFSVLSLITGLIIPVLFLIGAFQSKKALNQGQIM